MRSMILLAAWSLLSPVAALTQQPSSSTIRERVEVREVPVLVDVPTSWRSESAERLAKRMLALENGAARRISALQPVAAPAGPGYSRVEVAFDAAHCRTDVSRTAALALSEQAGRLVALGPVGISAWNGSALLAPEEPTTDAGQLASRLTERAPAACVSLATEQPEHELTCPGTPCLMIWVAAGWGNGPDADAAAAAAEATARRLAADGWAVLAFAPVAEPEPEAHVRTPQTRPGDDRSSWTINLLDPRGAEEGERAARESRRATELGLAPLRRIVAATAGELAPAAAELERALDSLARRSLLYYGTDRAPGGEPVAFELREPGENGRRLRAFAWAPPLRP